MKKKHQQIGIKFFENVLTKYKAAFATSSKYPLRYLVSKYVEILGCGCLGFFEYHEELDLLGFKPYYHYIPINTITTEKYLTKDGLQEKQINIEKMENIILKYIDSPEGENIRKNGYNYVSEKFTNKNRFDDLTKIITDLHSRN